MAALAVIEQRLKEILGDRVGRAERYRGELTIETGRENIVDTAMQLRDDSALRLEQLIDLCGVDYSSYGVEEGEGGCRSPRYAVVYHLQSVRLNHRLRLRAFLEDDFPVIDSVIGVWPVAGWFEREAFDLYGIMFEGHPDLRRILTDYGFIGHPFRKDFPLSGQVEMRYDPDKGRVIYQPLTIEPRVLVPKVIRDGGLA